MKLLILTQKVNSSDSVLGFFHRWIELFSERCEKVTVICLEEGVHNLPSNVLVRSLGKEKGVPKITYIKRFFSYIWSERKEYDSVFVHMNPEYVVLGGWLWRLLGKRIALWYVHRSVNLKLRVASLFAHRIFTTTKEACRLSTKKIKTVGHGIDMNRFVQGSFVEGGNFAHVGRITPIKNIERIADGVKLLSKKLYLYGETRASDAVYQEQLKTLYEDTLVWQGGIAPDALAEVYKGYLATVNAAPTGGMDKVVLESWASGVPVFVRNKAFASMLAEYKELFMFDTGEELARKVDEFFARTDAVEIVTGISERVRKEFNVEQLIERIVTDSVYVRN